MNTLLAYTKSTSYYPGELVELYTHYPSTIGWDEIFTKVKPNQKVSLDISYNRIKCTINQSNSTPGLVWNKISVPPKSKYLTIRYFAKTNLTISPFVRDLSNNVIYWISKKNNLVQAENNFITIALPINLLSLDIFLLVSSKFKLGDYFDLLNISFDFITNTIEPTEIILYSHKKNYVFSVQTYNLPNQKFIPNSFAFGCQWTSPTFIQLPYNILSGYYFLKLQYKSNNYWLPLIIKPLDNSNSKILVLANSNKWNAYNTWAGLDGSISLYTFSSTEYYQKNRILLLEGTDGKSIPSGLQPSAPSASGTKSSAPRVSNFVHTERPDRTMSSYIQKYFESQIKSTLFFNDHIYGEMFLPNYLDELNRPFDVITDQDMDKITISQISKYKIFIIHVHPEYWSQKQIDLIEQINKAKIGIMYIGGNGLYWKCTWNGNQMEVRKDRKIHLDGTQGGQWGELGSPGEKIVKVYYSKMYPTNIQFGFPYQAINPIHPLLIGLVDSSGNIGFKNLNSKSINYGPAGWEVDNIQIPSNIQYLIARSPDNLSNMIWKPIDTTGAVFSAGSIIYTGSLFVDFGIYQLTKRVIDLMD